jgi:nucleotide-binding universal stress UspA family protein
MKTILVLTDFSIRAAYAAEFALHFAIKNKANLLLCHAIEAIPSQVNEEPFNLISPSLQVLKNECMTDLKELGKRLGKLIEPDKHAFKPSIDYLADNGSLTYVAEKIIAERSISLVVLGSHRSNRITRLLGGNHVHGFIDKIKCPVLLIPECYPYYGIKTIGYATDHSFDNTKVMNYLVKLARPFKASLSINYVSPFTDAIPDSEIEAGFSIDFLPVPPNPPISYHHIKGDNVRASLEEITRLGLVDMLVMVHKHYNFFEGLFHSSITKHLVDDTQIPLLVLPHSFTIRNNYMTIKDEEKADIESGILAD